MNNSGPLDFLPLWLLLALTLGVVCGAVEFGFRLGRYRRNYAPEKETAVGSMVGAMLGLLGFMLAFAFGLAAARFDERRRTIVDEANAIGTTYLRAAMLPEPHQSAIRKELRDYVDVRLTVLQTEKIEHVISRSVDLHAKLWEHAIAVAAQDPRSIPYGLFVQSLNEMIDLHTSRVMVGIRSRIPWIVWVALYFIATLTMATVGYYEGLAGGRRSVVSLALVLAFSAVLFLIVDLDRPREGLIRTSQQAIVDLEASLRDPAP